MTKREKGFLVIAAVLAVFGTALMLLRGLGMRFSGILLLGIAALMLIYLILCRWERRSMFGKWCRRIFCVGCAVVIGFLAGLERDVLRHRSGVVGIPGDAVIVLGAGVNGTDCNAHLVSSSDHGLSVIRSLVAAVFY